jgi:hypothetical protein
MANPAAGSGNFCSDESIRTDKGKPGGGLNHNETGTMTARTVCATVGCHHTATHEGRCDQHRRRRGRPWQRLRQAVLQRDHHRCTICGQPGREVHHSRPLVLGGTELPPLDQLETRCSTHNPRGPGLT